MRRSFAGQLADELGEVGLDRADPGREQCVVQTDLVSGEGLDLDDLDRPGPAYEPDHELVRLLGVASPVHRSARLLDGSLELNQVPVEMTKHAALDRRA